MIMIKMMMIMIKMMIIMIKMRFRVVEGLKLLAISHEIL